MSRWREIKYYAHGTPTKTTKRLRRRHLFAQIITEGRRRSPCGLQVFSRQLGGEVQEVQKCLNCLKAIRARKKK